MDRLQLTMTISGSILALTLGAACGPSTTVSANSPDVSEVISRDGKPLGNVSFPTSCNASAQAPLERGLALLHHMTYEAADAEFRAAAEADPECAIAYWGSAMTYVHPLWPDAISDANLVRGRGLLDRAKAATHRSERECAYVRALEAYYRGDEEVTERDRLAAFLDGWTEVHATYADDPEAALFFALAQLATAKASDNGLEKRRAGGALAETIAARVPGHPGAHHYIIHAYDVPALAEKALETARHYGDVAPENSHALHMTSHIFTRLGLWPESIRFNVRAAAASSERLPDGKLSLHLLHALDYLAYAHLQMANDVEAERVLEAIRALEEPYQEHSVTAYAFAAVPVRYALERNAWADAARISSRFPASVAWDRYPYLEAISVFARGMGAARTGDVDAALAAHQRLDELEAAASSVNMAYDWGIQVRIQKTAVSAWLLYEAGETEAALETMREAAEMEGSTEKNPVTPGEVLPATELYGDMLLASKRYDEARERYEAALERSPNRFRSLWGAGRAAELAGDAATASRYYQALIENVSDPNGTSRPELEHARAFVS